MALADAGLRIPRDVSVISCDPERIIREKLHGAKYRKEK